MSSTISSDINKMLSALKNVRRGEHQDTTICMKQELLTSSKGSSRAKPPSVQSTRGRQQLTPELLRPHCDKCGCGEGLRPGLDCRCHCERCTSGKPRCTSPRMAERREEGESCASFLSKRTMAKAPSSSNLYNKKKSRNETNCKSSLETEATPLPPKPVEVPAREEVEIKPIKQKSCGASASAAVCRTKSEAAKPVRAPSKPLPDANPCKPLPEIQIKEMPSSRPVCKRANGGERCASLKGSTCSLWRESGRLRPMDTICYCDACIGFKSTTCSSPRMAEIRATGNRSRATKTI